MFIEIDFTISADVAGKVAADKKKRLFVQSTSVVQSLDDLVFCRNILLIRHFLHKIYYYIEY